MALHRVVVPPPSLDEHSGLVQGVESLSVEQLVQQLPVQALDIPVISGRFRLDVDRLHADPPVTATAYLPPAGPTVAIRGPGRSSRA